MQDIIKQVEEFCNLVNNLPSYVLIVAGCVIVGYVLKLMRKFPNEAIPLVVVLVGAILELLLADPREQKTPLRIWITLNILRGALMGFIAWALHNKLLSKVESKIPVLGGLLAKVDSPPSPANPDNPTVNPNDPTKPIV